MWLRIFIIGFGFFSISMINGLYNSYVPIFYGRYLASGALIGFLLAIDNILRLTLQPYMGALSDRTRTRLGRRIPYLVFGAPAAALFLALLPFGYGAGLWPLVLTAVPLVLVVACFQSPVIALMPDLVPPAKRSQANGIINWMGALGAAVAYLGGSLMYKVNMHLPFLVGAGLLLGVVVIFVRWVKEPASPPVPTGGEEGRNLAAAAGTLLAVLRDRQTALMMTAIFLWSIPFAGLEAWFTTFGVQVLGMGEADAAFLLTFFIGAILLFAIPAGLAGGRLGRRLSMSAGAAIFAAGLLALWFLRTPLQLQGALVVAGAGWSLIVVNALPALVELGPGREGAYTGLYYIASQLGFILAPVLFGGLRDALGWAVPFLASVVLLALSAVVVWRVPGAEPGTYPPSRPRLKALRRSSPG